MDKFFAPIVTGRGRDAEGGDVLTALVRDRDHDILFFFTAGCQAQAQNQRQQHTCKLFPISHVRSLLF